MILQNSTAGVRPRIGSIKDPESGREAARLISKGYPVGAFVRTTCTIWVDAGNPRAVASILDIKGARRTGRPLSLTLYAGDLVQMIDFDKIPPQLRPILGDPDELASRFSMLCLLRLPVTESAARNLPEVVVSKTPDGTRWIQNAVLGKSVSDFPLAEQMLDMGVGLPAVTSMNVSGQPEIVDQQEALEFCAEHGISLFLADPDSKAPVQGSYPIISIGPDGVKLLRQGHYPAYLLRYVLQTDVDTSQAPPPRFPLYETHCERCARRMDPHELHDEIVAMVEGSALL